MREKSRKPLPPKRLLSEDLGMKDTEAAPLNHQTASGAKRGNVILLLGVIAAVALAAHGILQRRAAAAKLARWTEARAIANVALVSPRLDTEPPVLTLPGRVEAFYEAGIDAQVSGYIKEWRTDYGAIVKKGETLAVIDTPMLDQQIKEAQNEIASAKSTKAIADLTAQRWDALRKSGAVSKQSADVDDADLLVRKAELNAAVTQLQRLQAKKAFADVIAPFDGVVTARNIDIGSYVTARLGDERSAPMFKVADIHAMRIYVNAPQNYAGELEDGDKATLSLPQYPGSVFHATILTTSRAIDPKSLTLQVELIAPNPDHALFPGAFAYVRFSLPTRSKGKLLIPVTALAIDDKSVRVATVVNGSVRFKKIVIAHDLGVDVEVASGVSPDDRLIDNPLDSLTDADPVRISGPAPTRSSNASNSSSGG